MGNAYKAIRCGRQAEEDEVRQDPIDDNVRDYFVSLVDEFEKRAKNSRPFLDHVRFFDDGHGQVTFESIVEKWDELQTSTAGVVNWAKAQATMQGANAGLQAKTPGVSWCSSFSVEEMMELLKHPADTGIVQADGSLKRDVLLAVLEACARYSGEAKDWVVPLDGLTKSVLPKCAARDAKAPAPRFSWIIPSWSFLAKNEHKDQHDVYADVVYPDRAQPPAKRSKSNAMHIRTYLGFYYLPLETAHAAIAKRQ